MMTGAAQTRSLPERLPVVGELVQVRSRRWLVEEVVTPESPGHSPVLRLACAEDDSLGQSLDVLWNYEMDRLILEEVDWGDLATKGFYDPRSLDIGGPGGVLHAKAIVADNEAVFVTSANLTEAALDRNIEVGILFRDRTLALSLSNHFQGLIDNGLLSPLPME